MELENSIDYDFKNLDKVSKLLDYKNRRGNNIIKVYKNDIAHTYVTGLEGKYLVITKTVDEEFYRQNLVSVLSEAGKMSVKEIFSRAESHGHNVEIICVLDEQCDTFLTRMKDSRGKVIVDIPFSIHAIYGEWKYGDKSKIMNLEVIEPYLKKIEDGTFKTTDIGKFMFLHLAPDKHIKAKVNLHDAKYIIPIYIKNKKELLDGIKEAYMRVFIENPDLYSKISKDGFEFYAADIILNNAGLKSKFDVDVCLEIRCGSPINKPPRGYLLNNAGLKAAKDRDFVHNRNKSEYLLPSSTIPSPVFMWNKDYSLRCSVYNKVIEEGKRLGLTEGETLERFAIVEDSRFIRVNLKEDYHFSRIKE